MTILSERDLNFELHETHGGDSEWAVFAESRTATFFCSPGWSRVLDAGYGIHTRVYLLKQNGKICLGIPAAKFDFGFFRLIHAYTPYGEWVGDLDLVPVFLKKLEAHVRKAGIHQIRITQPYYQNYTMDASYRARRDCLQLLDLNAKTEESLWLGYKKNIRRDVRIAQRAGVMIKQLQTPQEIDRYYEMYRGTMGRKGVLGPHPRRLYHQILKAFKQGSEAEAVFLAADYRGEYIGGVLFLFWKDTAYLLGNASDSRHHSLCPNDLLIHESLVRTVKKGCRFFDFMTTQERFLEPGKLSAFKEKWGAVRHAFTVYEKDIAPGRVKLWNGLWKFANSSAGSAFLRPFLNR